MRVCADAGWAADRVVSDYGEDLIVQTTLDHQVDPFRTLLQVKTTDRILRDGKISCRVRRDHALRWIRNAEPVVVVLWHKASDRGWYSVPRDHLREYDVLLSAAATLEIVFATEAAFTTASIHTLAWELRLGYFKQQLLGADRDDHDELARRADGVGTPTYRSRMPVILLNLFRLLRISSEAGLNPEIRLLFARLRRKIQEKERDLPRSQRSSSQERDNMAATLTVLVQVERVTGRATPTVVAQHASEALMRVLKSLLA